MVVEAIRFRDPRHYQLHAFVVMPNHVHLLVTPVVVVCKVMQSLKRFTAREGNRMLGLTGKPFWQDESYDRLVRNEKEFERIASYIEMNPVTAGLAATPEEFRWSSSWPIDNRPQVDNLPHIGVHLDQWQFCFTPHARSHSSEFPTAPAYSAASFRHS